MLGSRRRSVALVVIGLLAAVTAACSPPAPSSGPSPVPSAVPSSSASAVRGEFAGLVDIGGGRKLYLECHGTGSPTVILQSGNGDAGDIWNAAEADRPAVMREVGQFTRVCAYDRPGSIRALTDAGSPASSPLPGRSDPAPMPRTAADVVTELHTLLTTAGVPGPYVLVGHSLGGLFTLLYARTYPDQVAGMVLVDPTPLPLRKLLTPQQWDSAYQKPWMRLQTPIPGYQPEAWDATASFKQIEAAPPLPKMPVTILVASTELEVPSPLPPGMSADAANAVVRVFRQAQAEFAESIPGARLITVPDTTHYIQVLRPDVVSDAVRQIIAQVTASPRPSTT
jgi:pimeloyl-ACP methyl ester carboxylesterase